MTLENPGLSRRKLLRTTAIGVPAAGLLAFGSTLVTATNANAVDVDGIWGEGTTVALQQFLNQALGAGLEVDGLIGSQPASAQEELAVFGSGWDWVSDSDASGSATITAMQNWLGVSADGSGNPMGERKATTSPSITCSVGWAAWKLTARLVPALSKPYKITTVSRQMVAWMDLQRLSRLCRMRLISTSVKTRCCSFTGFL